MVVLFFCFFFKNLNEQKIETEIFYNIIPVFTVSFDTFKASVLNKSINFFKKKSLIPKQ